MSILVSSSANSLWREVVTYELTSNVSQVDFSNLKLDDFRLLRVIASNLAYSDDSTYYLADLVLRVNDMATNEYMWARHQQDYEDNSDRLKITKLRNNYYGDLEKRKSMTNFVIFNKMNNSYKSILGDYFGLKDRASGVGGLIYSSSLITKLSFSIVNDSSGGGGGLRSGCVFTVLGMK